MSETVAWAPLAKTYNPIRCGNIDGTDVDIHDKGVMRALNSNYRPNKGVSGDPLCTIFVGRLSLKTSEDSLRSVFEHFGTIKQLRLVRDLVTGYSKGYAFIEYSSDSEAKRAFKKADDSVIDGCKILVDMEKERTMEGWIPRRLGGGFGGKKEAGQLRFGCKDRPFRKPYLQYNNTSQRSNQEREARVAGSPYKRDYHENSRSSKPYDRKKDRRR